MIGIPANAYLAEKKTLPICGVIASGGGTWLSMTSSPAPTRSIKSTNFWLKK